MNPENSIGNKWSIFLRWLFFLPVALLVMFCVKFAIGLVAALGQWGSLWTEIGTTVAEPWGFLVGGLWLLPRFRKPFILFASACYVIAYSWVAFYLPLQTHKPYNWHSISIDFVAIVSCLTASIHFFKSINNSHMEYETN